MDEGNFNAMLDNYTASLAKLDSAVNEISDELGNIEIPDDLLGELSDGRRI
jgi:hypothetical protein